MQIDGTSSVFVGEKLLERLAKLSGGVAVIYAGAATVTEMKEMKETEFTFPTDLWARILYDMVVSYRDDICDLDLIMDSLIPLYFGRTFSFVKRTKRMSTRQAEEAIEEDCMTFEMTKPYLVNRWMKK